MATKKKKNKALANIDRDTWQNTAKEQPYLMPGTDEYEERQSDLRLHDPFRPDDEMHDELEQYNEVQSENRTHSTNESSKDSVSKRRYRNQMAKRAEFPAAKKAAAIAAEKTPDPSDDERVAKRGMPKNIEKIIYNDGVSEDEFVPRVLQKYQ